MHVYVQMSTSTTLPRRPAAVKGGELSHSVARSSEGKAPSQGAFDREVSRRGCHPLQDPLHHACVLDRRQICRSCQTGLRAGTGEQAEWRAARVMTDVARKRRRRSLTRLDL